MIDQIGLIMNEDDILVNLMRTWRNSPKLGQCITSWTRMPGQEGTTLPFPAYLQPVLCKSLVGMGIQSLYSHQVDAIDAIQEKNNVIISTGTASGKSLCYILPIFNQLIADPESTALCFFPTKALTSDQYDSFHKFDHELTTNGYHGVPFAAAIYDGDTPSSQRSLIREKTRILLTNPDMLHIAVLPHHTIWERFFRNLKYVVIDEVHTYRGVFGSHIANLIRRLKRVLQFYGADPIFVMTSATIANPQQLAEKLIEAPVTWINNDGSPKGERNFVIYDPPIVNQELSIRQGALDATAELSKDLIRNRVQTLAFCRTRRGVELLIRQMYNLFPQQQRTIRGYRSGYLKNDRREIEMGLKNGSINLAVATNALELGVDIGGMDAVLLAGYPGTVAATRQRAGRAGRSTRPSLAVMIASMNPLDQYLSHHPEFLIDRSPEEALINPDNLLILLQHIQCAAFELPFQPGDHFGNLDLSTLQEYMEFLNSQGILQENSGKYFFMSDDYPANAISLRSTTGQEILLQVKNADLETDAQIIGKVDYSSSLWMTHPGAIYLQQGNTFLVETLDLEKNIASLVPTMVDYYTIPIKQEEIQIIEILQQNTTSSFFKTNYGEINVTTQVTGFKKIQWDTQQVLSIESLNMPATTLRTFGCWISLNDSCVQKMREEKLWLSDPNEYGPEWESLKKVIKKRDHYTCQNCGKEEKEKPFHVHHKIPFRSFTEKKLANAPANLITLCPDCHRMAESNVKIRSAVSGLKYVMNNLAPLLAMCDIEDIGSVAEASADFAEGQPAVLLYDTIPAGVGLSEAIFHNSNDLLQKCYDLVNECECLDGCPSCVGPSSENGSGGKKETKRLLELLLGKE